MENEKTNNFEEKLKKENIMFKLADLDIDALLSKYAEDKNYGEFEDYEVYKNFSLSKESWIDFLEVKYRQEGKTEPNIKYFGVVIIQGYLCAFDEITDLNMLYFEAYLEDLLSIVMVKSLKYDYMTLQNQEDNKQTTSNESSEQSYLEKELNYKKEDKPMPHIYDALKVDLEDIDKLSYSEIRYIYSSLDMNTIPKEHMPDFDNDNIDVLKEKLKHIMVKSYEKEQANISPNYLV